MALSEITYNTQENYVAVIQNINAVINSCKEQLIFQLINASQKQATNVTKGIIKIIIKEYFQFILSSPISSNNMNTLLNCLICAYNDIIIMSEIIINNQIKTEKITHI